MTFVGAPQMVGAEKRICILFPRYLRNLLNICLDCEKTPKHWRLDDFCGSFPGGGSKTLSVSGSQNFLFPFLIVHSHETGREVTNASQVSIPNICYWYKI